MEKIILDFSNCKNALDMHHLLKETLDFPDYYGKNLSALWDCLRDCWDSDDYITIIIAGYNKVPKEWQPYMDKILVIFQRIHDETPNVTFIVES